MELNRTAVLVKMNEGGIRWQQDLAARAGISRVTLGLALNGKKKISVKSIEKIAAALGTDVSKITLKEKKVSRRGKRSAKAAETENTIAG